ncbi:MAG: site-2 protease family protein [Acidobacteria bacterium]|nr:site-2 protease family protein [Acidobacteriota bacterium]
MSGPVELPGATSAVSEDPSAASSTLRSASPPRRRPPWLALVMFLLTFGTTLVVGIESSSGGQHLLAEIAHGRIGLSQAAIPLLLAGLPYVLALLGFFMAHEMGHYLACKRYGVDCTVPYFIPVPSIISLIGTLGAVIRIRGRIPSRRALFDIGIAGPLAGFAVAVPLVIVGVVQAPVEAAGPIPRGAILFGDSLLTWTASWLLRPEARDAVLILNPIYLAGWVGIFATALNLLPAGQLDGGHILYALSPRGHARMAFLVPAFLLSIAATRVLLYREWTAVLLWAVWSALILLFGRRHPPPTVWDRDLGRGRTVLAWIAAAILVLCFMPVPLSIVP